MSERNNNQPRGFTIHGPLNRYDVRVNLGRVEMSFDGGETWQDSGVAFDDLPNVPRLSHDPDTPDSR